MKTYSRGDAYPADIVAWAEGERDRLKFRVLPPLVLYDANGRAPTIGLPNLPNSGAPMFVRITGVRPSTNQYSWVGLRPGPDGTWVEDGSKGHVGVVGGGVNPSTGEVNSGSDYSDAVDPLYEIEARTTIGNIVTVAWRAAGGGLEFQSGCTPP